MIPELSICIPTYNRAEMLARSLNAALLQCSGLPVEICVSNNASSGSTKELLRSFSRAAPCLRYENRVQNIGIDRNILAAVRMARGRFVLPIGDDELLAPGAITSILAALQAQSDLVILNGRFVENGRCSAPRLGDRLRGRTIASLPEAFTLLWDQMPLGGFIAPRGYADPHFADRYLGTHHAYSGAAWDFLLDHHRRTGRTAVVCMAESSIEFHRVEKAWAADSASIYFEQIPRWFDLIPEYYAAEVAVARREFQRRCATSVQLIHLRAAGRISGANMRRYLRGFGFPARLRGCIIAALPALMAHAFVHAVSRLMSRLIPGLSARFGDISSSRTS